MRPASAVLGQLEVLHALVLRETRTRFGEHQLGYLWALLEPLLWIGTFWAMYWLLSRSAPDGMELVAFLTTALAPYLLFRHVYSRAATAIGSNRGLLFYPQIQPLDLVWARTVLEFATMTETDLGAIYDYLRTVPPVTNRVVKYERTPEEGTE